MSLQEDTIQKFIKLDLLKLNFINLSSSTFILTNFVTDLKISSSYENVN